MKPNSGIGLVLIILVLAAFLVALYGLTSPILNTFNPYQTQEEATVTSIPTQNLTSDWETYRNQSFGYEIKIPPQWRAEALSENQIAHIMPLSLKPTDDVPITITVSNNPLNKNEDEWIDTLFGDSHDRDEIEVSDTIWKRVRSALSSYQAMIYYKKHGDYMYELYSLVLKGSEAEMFQTMLPTFKFTN